MTWFRVLLSALVLLTPFHVLLAAVCGNQRIVHQQHAVVQNQQVYAQQQQYVVRPVVFQQVNPYAYYSAGAFLQEESVSNRLATQVEAMVQERLKEALQKPNLPAPAGANQPQTSLGLQTLQQKCAKCHIDRSKQVMDNDAPALFDERNQWVGTPGQAASSKALAKRGAMPPPPGEPLTDDEYLAVAQWLDTVK